ncbi:MAG: glutamate formimidoyltransferase [Chloroflexi bacterium]|nr:glutamate formimidoyltransferase [Chloroflexota bacterium]
MTKLVQAVPNFSEGKRAEVVEQIVDCFRGVPGVKLIDYSWDPDMNRAVVTVLGQPEPLKQALFNMTARSISLINMQEHNGAHPCIGAQDTIPIFPFKNITLEECVQLAGVIGREIYEKLHVPVYFSGANARTEERRRLENIRQGNYNGLKQDVAQGRRLPDLGDRLHPTAGAVIVSASTLPLVAFNVILGTSDLSIAKKIARIVRGPSGGFSTVRAIGLRYEARNQVGVSMNMFDYVATPLYRVFEVVKMEAERYSVPVIGSEIVGVVPQEALINSLEYFLKLEGFKRSQILENHLLDLPEEIGEGQADLLTPRARR